MSPLFYTCVIKRAPVYNSEYKKKEQKKHIILPRVAKKKEKKKKKAKTAVMHYIQTSIVEI